MGVLIEGLVEIAQAEQQNGVGVTLLDFQVLAPYWGQDGLAGSRIWAILTQPVTAGNTLPAEHDIGLLPLQEQYRQGWLPVL